jgi:hypothetical protein
VAAPLIRPRPRRTGSPTRLNGAPSPALGRSWGGLRVYGRFPHSPLFRAICGAWAAQGRPPPEVPSRAALRRPQGGFHSPHLGQFPAFAPAFSLRSADAAGDSDVGLDGIMNHAPGAGLIRRQRGQVGEIGTAASPHATSCRARHGIEPHVPERLAADAAKSRFHGHMLHIQTPARFFNSGLFATGTGTFCYGHRHFRPSGRFPGVEKGPGRSLDR